MKPDAPTLEDFGPGPVQLWTAHPNGELRYVNEAVGTALGRPGGVVREWGWADVIHPDDLEEVAARFSHALESGEPYVARFRLHGADGGWRWQVARADPRHVDGTLVGWVGVTMDVHDVS